MSRFNPQIRTTEMRIAAYGLLYFVGGFCLGLGVGWPLAIIGSAMLISSYLVVRDRERHTGEKGEGQ